MGFLLHFLLAIAVVTLGQAGFDTGWTLPIGAAVLCLVPTVLARWIVRRSLRGHWRSAAVGARLLSRLAPILHLLAVSVFGWVAAAERWAEARGGVLALPEPVVLAGLLPYVVYEFLVIDARARLADPRPDQRDRMRGFQVRMMMSGLLPLVFYLGISWLAGLDRVVRTYLEEVALLNAAFAVLLLGVFAMLLPALLRNTWETVPLERGIQRDVLEAVARQANFRCKSILRWKTGNQMSNAAIVGFAPWHRVVLFSDALLGQLSLRELAAVFGHEIGHARRHHVTIFLVSGLAFFLVGHLLLAGLALESEGWTLFTIAGLAGLWYAGFGYMSRRFELEADLSALELGGDPVALCDALERVGGYHGRRESSWRHFSTVERTLFLQAAHRDPGVARRLRTQLRRITVAGTLVFVVALGFEVRTLAGSLDEDSIRTQLRLGRFGAAAELAAEGGDVSPELRELALAAGEFAPTDSGSAPDADELEARALAALEAGDGALGLTYLALAGFQDRPDLQRPHEVLRLLMEGDREAADAELADLETWEPGGSAPEEMRGRWLDVLGRWRARLGPQ